MIAMDARTKLNRRVVKDGSLDSVNRNFGKVCEQESPMVNIKVESSRDYS